MPQNNMPIVNPSVVLREEEDNWAILYNPDTGDAFSLNPMGVFVWKLLDGVHREEDILKKARDSFKDVPEEAKDQLESHLQALVERGLAGYRVEER